MTTTEFFKACASFDWYYEMSEDHRTWRAGSARKRQLREEAATDTTKQSIFEAWEQHFFTGKAFGTTRAPRPLLEDFVSVNQ